MSVIYEYPVQYPRHEAALKGMTSAAAETGATASKFMSAVPGSTPPEGIFGGDGFSFKDVFDAVNPLQQLPVIGSLYRSATGDTMSVASRLAGGALLGGPIGFLMAAAGSAIEAIAGGDVIEQAVALLGSGQDTAQSKDYVLKAYTTTQGLS